MNRIMNQRVYFHILHKVFHILHKVKMAKFYKKPPVLKEKLTSKVLTQPHKFLNTNGPWVPWQEQNAFIFHRTRFNEQNHLSYRYQGHTTRVSHTTSTRETCVGGQYSGWDGDFFGKTHGIAMG